jgi:hypothetical protein
MLSVGILLKFYRTYLRVLRIRRFQDVAKKQLGVLAHDSAGECITLVRTQIMAVSPPTTDKLLEISASIELLIVGREIVEDL